MWRIERVGAGVEADTAGGRVGAGRLGLPQRGVRLWYGDIRIEGIVKARASVSSVVLTGRVDGEIVNVIALGRLSANDTAPFVLRGAAPSVPGEFGCALDVEYFNIGALRHDPPLRLKWPGDATRNEPVA